MRRSQENIREKLKIKKNGKSVNFGVNYIEERFDLLLFVIFERFIDLIQFTFVNKDFIISSYYSDIYC